MVDYCCLNTLDMSKMCKRCYEAFFSDPEYQIQMVDGYGLEPMVSSSSMAACECGSEASGGTTHSHWCPKYRKV